MQILFAFTPGEEASRKDHGNVVRAVNGQAVPKACTIAQMISAQGPIPIGSAGMIHHA